MAEELQELWEDSQNFSLVEEASGDSLVDGEHILARIEGPAFFPDTTSGNNVHYPKKAWQNAISENDFTSKLNDRLIFGTIGHDIKRIDDAAVRDGKFSHIINKVWIDENNQGKAEYLVLNTGPGQVLNTLMRAGAKLKVSTKAQGLLESRGARGGKTVNPDNFHLERIDFVINPGYLKAQPELLESLNLTEEDISEENNMSDQTVISVMQNQIDDLKTEKGEYKGVAEALQTALDNIKTEVAESSVILAQFTKMGTAEELAESLALLGKYQAIDTPDKIQESLDESSAAITEFQEMFKEGDIAENLISEESVEMLESYKELGSVDDIKSLVEKSEEASEALITYKKVEVAEAHKVSTDKIDEMLAAGMSFDTVKSTLAILHPVDEMDHGKDDDEDDDKKDDKKKKKEVKESSTKDYKDAAKDKDDIKESKAGKAGNCLARSLMTH